MKQHQQQHAELVETDDSSLTNSRSSTPPLYDEDDPAALLRKQQQDAIQNRFQRKSPNSNDTKWRDKMNVTANYKWSKKKASPRLFQSSPRGSPPSTLQRGQEASNEVMMNLSAVKRSSPTSRDQMSNVTGTSTEITTNRSVDVHRKLFPNRSTTAQYKARLRKHQQKKWSPPPRKPIEIKSLLSDSVTEATEESTQQPLYPGSMPMGRLGQHVGQEKLQENVQQQHARKDSVGSIQDNSLTSSVGVETGVYAVPKSEPALKRVFRQNHPIDGISPIQQQKQQQRHASAIALTRPQSPLEDKQTEYRVPRASEFPPRAPASREKPASSIASNPFMVKYSARESPLNERRGLYDIGSPQSPNASSDGGWTPVPLSSSGMISEDFVLDLDHTPDAAKPVTTALFSADRIPSTSKSPFDKLYRPPRDDPSYDSSAVGPPDIHRITATQLKSPATDAPGVCLADDNERDDDDEEEAYRVTPKIGSPAVESPQAAVTSAPPAIPAKEETNEGEKQVSPRSLPLNRTRRRALLQRRRRWPPHEHEHETGEADSGSAENGRSSSQSLHENTGRVDPLSIASFEKMPAASVRRNLFLTDNEQEDEWSRRPSNNGTSPTDLDGARQMKSDNRREVTGSTPVQDSEFVSSPVIKATNEHVPPWKARLQKEMPAKAKKSTMEVNEKGNSNDKQPTREFMPPWKRKLIEQGQFAKKEASTGKHDDPDSNTPTQREYAPPWKLKQMAIKASPAGGNHEIVPVNTPEPKSDYTSPWKQTALEKRSPKMNSTADTGAVPSSETLRENIPKWKFELMKKKGLVKADQLVTPEANGKPEETTPKPRQTPPCAKLSVRDRVNKFSSPTEETNDAVSPWVSRSKTPLVRYEVKETCLVQSAPPRLCSGDRVVALSGETHDSSFISTSSSRSKRSHSEALDEPGQSNEVDREGPEDDSEDAVQSPRKSIKTTRSTRQSRVSAKLLGAASAQADPSVASGPSLDERRASRNSFVLAAHLAATADEVSPQDRYRRRFRYTDDTTATDGSREISDVQSLKSFFEASVATIPSDEDNDDRTVESLRSKFEPIPEKQDEPNGVSKMRAMWENPKSASSGRSAAEGNDIFTKFEPKTKRWTPPATNNTRRTFKALNGSPAVASAANTARVSSAPSKLQLQTRPSRSPPPKPEDMDPRRQTQEQAAIAKDQWEPTADGPKVMSVAERIRALKSKQSPDTGKKQPAVAPSVSARNVPGNARSSPEPSSTNRDLPRDPPAANESQRVRPDGAAGPKEEISPKEEALHRPGAAQFGAFPSVKDRVSAFSSGKTQQSSHVQSNAPGRTLWHPESKNRIRSYSDRHLNSQGENDQAQHVMSIPSDEKAGKGAKSHVRRGSDASSGGTTGTDSEYDDGVTLDLSVAEISQLTNPTCIQSKDEAGADSSSEASSEHTSDVNRGSNVEGKHPSEASSSQTSEAAAPLIARIRFSDDASGSVNSTKGAVPSRTRSTTSAARWEPLTPVVDETTEPARQSPDGTQETAWSPDEIQATFPVESNVKTGAAKINKVWQPFQGENRESSSSFGTSFTTPDPFEMAISESTSFGRMSENTPVRRNTGRSPPPIRSSPEESKRSPAHGSPFSRTHPSQRDQNQVSAGLYRSATPRTPQSSPKNDDAIVGDPRSSTDTRLPTGTGISKHALLMSKLRSLKEARIRRNAATGFHRNSVFPSERQSNPRPPAGNSNRGSPPASALAPFLRPETSRQNSRPSASNRYPDRTPESSRYAPDDERSLSTRSLSTKSSTQFGGHKFVESLELD
jgi:hypothetical protein